MGNAVAYEGHKIAQKNMSQDYTAKQYDSCKYWSSNSGCSGGYDYPTESSTKKITGTLKSASNNVYINNKSVSYKSGGTTESCSWVSTPSDYYSGGSIHSSSSGSVNGGSSTVYVNGKAIARKGDSVTTHESGQSTTVEEGSSNVYAG